MSRHFRRPESSGFTLVELVVVVLIIGILAAVAIPQYTKTMESSKADDAIATVKMIGTTNRMYHLDRNYYANGGYFTSATTNTVGCSAAGAGPDTSSGNDLVACKYLAIQDWDLKPYHFYASDGATDACGFGGSYVACAKRAGGSGAYANWGFTIDATGKVCGFNGAQCSCASGSGC